MSAAVRGARLYLAGLVALAVPVLVGILVGSLRLGDAGEVDVGRLLGAILQRGCCLQTSICV